MNQFVLRQDCRRVGTGSSLGLCRLNLELTNEKQFSLNDINVRIDLYLVNDPQVMILPTVRHQPKYSKNTVVDLSISGIPYTRGRILCNVSSR
jgi:hypothetical protein